MPQQAIDVNTEEKSSNSSADAGGQRHDGLEDSSASDKSTQQDEKDQTLEEAIDATLEQNEKEIVDPSEKESNPENGLDKKDDKETEVKDKEDGDKKEETQEVEGEKEDLEPNKPVPYDRFQEVITEKNQLADKLRGYEERELKYYNSINDFCRQNNISPEQHDNALRILALQNTDPEKAIPLLQAELNAMLGLEGGKLPKDLQEKVDNAKMDLEDAKEMARLRGLSKAGEVRQQNLAKQKAAREELEARTEMSQKGAEWVTAKMKADPDFFEKKKESDPSGKFEMVMDRYMALLNATKVVDGKVVYTNQVTNAAQMLALMEKAYKEVDVTYVSLTNRGRKPIKEPLRSSRDTSSKTATLVDAPNLQEAVRIGLKERGHSVS